MSADGASAKGIVAGYFSVDEFLHYITGININNGASAAPSDPQNSVNVLGGGNTIAHGPVVTLNRHTRLLKPGNHSKGDEYNAQVIQTDTISADLKIVNNTFWSYTKYARPEIFRRQATAVNTLADMMHMMRYNNYKNVEFSLIPNCTGATNNECNPKHSAMLTIASRGDMMTVYSTNAENQAHYGDLYSWMAQGCFGSHDAKIGSWKNRHTMTSYFINGPTNDQQPTFAWGQTANCPLVRQPPNTPITYDFPWVAFELSRQRERGN